MQTLAFDIGGTKIHGAVVNSEGRVLIEKKIPTPTESWSAGRAAILSLCTEFRAQFPDVKACGIACAGPLHAPSGRLMNPTNMNWGDVHLTKDLQDTLKIPVILENDAAAAALAEAWVGEFKTRDSLMAITLGTGLGIGITVDRKLYRGGKGLHPEGGHMIIDLEDNEIFCGCGNPGCAEGLLSGSHFLERARKNLNSPTLPITDVIEKAKTGDTTVLLMFDRYAKQLAQFLYNDSIVFYPDVILLSGSFSKAHGFFLEKTRTQMKRFFARRERSEPGICPEIHLSKLDNAGLLGAGALGLLPPQA